ncbi:MAG: insulinase family protein [Verrucomicrobia bacterium]|nr:insulinase family protein [Verrucomicrobiota bacterium]
MKQTRLIFALTALLLTLHSANAETWPQDTSDLKPENKVVFGALENGLRYVIFPSKTPLPGHASMRLYINAGSLMEEDDQQGMAHFLEHLAFNGSKHFPAGTMVEKFQRLGMGFGADTNAHTSFKETVYKLELPRVDEKMLAEGLQLFRDDLDGMLLEKKEIDRERGVILSEKLARDSVETRVMEEGYRFSLPDALLPKRLPIGLEETIKQMPRERFVDFYEKWYTPKRAVVVIAGDVDVPLVESLIKKQFSDAKPRRGDAADPDLGKVTAGRGLVARLKTEMEAPATEISIETLSPASKEPDTMAKRRARMVRNLADAVINQRFSEIAKKEGSPIMEGQASNSEMFKFVQSNSIDVQCKPDQWKAALALAEQVLRRALEHGFTNAEFDEARATILKGVRLRSEGSETRQNRALADSLVVSLAAEQVYTDPADDLKRVEKQLAEITASESLAALRKAWDSKDIQIFIGGNLKLDDAEKTILAAYQESRKTPVSAPQQDTEAHFAYAEFGAPGKIMKRVEVKDLEVTQVIFENGVRANLKKTDFEKNSVRLLVNFGGGKLSAPSDKPGLIPYTQSVFEAGGLEKHSVDDLRRLFASKTVGIDFAVGDDAFMLSGRTTPGDLRDELGLACAYLAAPGYREEADRQLRKNFDSIYTQLEHTAEGVMQNQVVGFIHGGDFRFQFPRREVMEQRNLSEMKAWLAPELNSSYLEIAVVGDIDVEKTLEAIAATFGALPKRAERKPDYTKERLVQFPAEPKDKDFVFNTDIPRAYALGYWPTGDMSDIRRVRRLSLLAEILDDRLRLKIRQELGDSYSPASYQVPSDTFTGYGYITAMATLKPEQVAKVKPMFLDIAQEMVTGGITEDEFQRARAPMLESLTKMRRDNDYWLKRVLRNCQEQPQRLDWARTMVDDLNSVTRDDIAALAKQYATSARAVTIGLIPEQKK